MRLSNISEKKNFCYCRVRSLKDLSPNKKICIKPGDAIYAMMYPSGHWHLFNTTDESEQKQFELMIDAKLGVDFEEIE